MPPKLESTRRNLLRDNTSILCCVEWNAKEVVKSRILSSKSQKVILQTQPAASRKVTPPAREGVGLDPAGQYHPGRVCTVLPSAPARFPWEFDGRVHPPALAIESKFKHIRDRTTRERLRQRNPPGKTVLRNRHAPAPLVPQAVDFPAAACPRRCDKTSQDVPTTRAFSAPSLHDPPRPNIATTHSWLT